MAAELVGGAFLSAFLQVLSDRMASKDVLNFIRRKKLNNRLLQKLKIKLLSAESVVNDAEEKQIKNQAVRKWLAMLEEVIYDADDLVDEINSEALRCEIEGESEITSQQVVKFISTPFTAFKKQDVDSKIEEILDRLDFTCQQKDFLGLKVCVQNKPPRRTPSTSLVEESAVYGRDDDKKAILDLLLSDEVGGNKISVIPIVGMGGIGKTTLAQLIYNSDNVKNHFEIKAWACVSDDFDVFRITKIIFESVTSQTCDITDLNRLQENLKQKLVEKKFLLVLDDVWNEDYIEWDKLKSPFEFGACGSKIIVTTRSEKVANMVRNVLNYKLKTMSEDDCWLLFVKHAFGNIEPGAHPNLVEIGRKLVRKCQGLPLAVKFLDGLLRNEENPQEWERILENDIWESSEMKHDILPSLWLSYYYLPQHLKRCFAYCSNFPKDYQFEKENLILLWMSQNLLESHKTKRAEEVGDEYFNYLLSRSLFQRHETWGFTMHDLVNDLAKFVSGDFVLRLDGCYSHNVAKKARHLSYMRGNIPNMKNLDTLFENKYLRTFLPLGCYSSLNSEREFSFRCHKVSQTMQYLRALSLSEYSITKLPNSFGNLRLLRYLDLSSTDVKEIPYSVCNLYNLQTLLLKSCRNLSGLPHSIGKLKHLRHLDLSYTNIKEIPDTVCNFNDLYTLLLSFCTMLTRLPTSLACLSNLRHLDIECTCLKEMPLHMSRMKCLRTLSDFVVSKDSGCNIKELKEFQNLHGSLCISRLQNIVDVEDILKANLKDKSCLDLLSLSWDGNADDSQKEREVLNGLQPHINLKRLLIRNYCGTCFPNWVGHHSFCGIVEVKLSYCRNCYLLPPLGQLPSLERLDIVGFDMLERIGEEFYSGGGSCSVVKPFKSLKYLSFSKMPHWKKWSLVGHDGEDEVFSCLKKLNLFQCPKLDGAHFPNCLPALTALRISGCDQLVSSFPRLQSPELHLLTIFNCQELWSFPRGDLPSNIRSIEIHGCKKLESFSEDGWPSNLKSLLIADCGKLFAHDMKWDLQALTSLTSLQIISIEEVLVSFPKEGLFPTTLTHLELNNLQNLKSLNDMAFQLLISLKELRISFCNQLWCVPEGLPASLCLLVIYECDLLKQRCQRGIGEDWLKIAHIPRIQIDQESI
nr:putative disease resistance RPP13-like protein 1 [Ziziphus jujuba var. spinosa]XP_048329515.1 putative disease resistance RPP13-like protein 1 [Ziziphus jujuba var. spinosa]XP_048329516.1 putative disease resistance RPP13-like protein 1 [Ziziphus jujuba var. spinosa]XP_048329517.1 putative disease resistance RPP13-like protein 1 [Ziziphus jujuba var. spinosa]XP_048329518.1 putative disease resistance RPP13-like protein 1 [Ziziphus jujuba var. spinosa]XP_048329519.1 putative disease resistan